MCYKLWPAHSEPIQITDQEGELILCAFPNMPDAIRAKLTVNLIACLENQPLNLYETSSESTGRDFAFNALHLSWYNRHGMRVSPQTS